MSTFIFENKKGSAMEDLLKLVDAASAKIGLIAAAATAFFLSLPKLLNAFKSDKVDSSVLSRLLSHEARMNLMDKTIHKQQIRITRFMVLMIQLEALLEANGVQIPATMRVNMQALMNGDDDVEETK